MPRYMDIFLTSRTAEPTADAKGLPAKVLKCRASPSTDAISGVVTTAPIGNPLPIPLASVTAQNI